MPRFSSNFLSHFPLVFWSFQLIFSHQLSFLFFSFVDVGALHPSFLQFLQTSVLSFRFQVICIIATYDYFFTFFSRILFFFLSFFDRWDLPFNPWTILWKISCFYWRVRWVFLALTFFEKFLMILRELMLLVLTRLRGLYFFFIVFFSIFLTFFWKCWFSSILISSSDTFFAFPILSRNNIIY